MKIVETLRDFVAKEIQAKDFHAGRPQRDHMDYYDAAEDKINAMNNMELLDLLDRATTED